VLEAAAAFRTPAAAGERAVVVRLAVVTRQLLARFDAAQRVELDAAVAHAHVGVRLARVVDVFEGARGVRRVERAAVAELDDHDAVGGARAPARLALGDDLAAQLAQLPARGQRRGRVEPAPLYPAAPDFEVEGFQARGL
jgi:hypothetical protein